MDATGSSEPDLVTATDISSQKPLLTFLNEFFMVRQSAVSFLDGKHRHTRLIYKLIGRCRPLDCLFPKKHILLGPRMPGCPLRIAILKIVVILSR